MKSFALVLLFSIGCEPVSQVGIQNAPGDAASSGRDVWVDPAGTDDAAHGDGPGVAAFRTITFALTRAGGTIHVDAGVYSDASGETFPLVMTGRQILAGPADLSATISRPQPATPPNDSTYVVVLSGDANQVDHLAINQPVADPNCTDCGADCIHITTSGSHLISNSSLQDCEAAIDFGDQDGATISNVTADALNCLNGVGNGVHIANFSCTDHNDWIFVCGTGLTGCGTQVTGRIAACDPTELSNFSAPCP